MKILIVQAQPDPASFSAAIEAAFVRGAEAAGHSLDTINLVNEGFSPCFGQPDLDRYHGTAPVPDDVRDHQARVDAADVLTLIFPIYWWSFPAILKGWIDRVFISGWAFRYEEGKVVGTMRDIPVYLLGIGGGSDDGYTKHGYYTAFDTQVTTGIFKFCGIRRIHTHLLLDVESGAEYRDAHLEAAEELGRSIT